MEVFSLGFIILMVILSGVIAYFGDVIGRKIGKKKLKIGNLRPKHTAAISTGLFGSLTTLVVILILATSSEQVRVWILEGNRARAELATTRNDLKTEQEKLKTAMQNQKKAEDSLKGMQDKNRQANETNQQLVKQSGSLKSQIGSLQKDIASFRSNLNKVSSQYTELKKTFTNTQAEYRKLQANNATFVKTNKEVQSKNLELLQENLKIQHESENLKGEVENLKKDKTDLELLQKQLRQQLLDTTDAQKKELAARRLELEDAEAKLSDANSLLKNVQSQITILNSQLANSNKGLLVTRVNPMLFSIQDELSRVPVQSRLNQAEARALLLGAMDRAGQTALSRGGKAAPNGQDFAAFIDLPTGNGVVTAQSQFNSLVEALTNGKGPRVLILRTLFNTFQGEFAPLDAVIIDNPVVYEQGAMVFEFRVDGRLPENEIADTIGSAVQGPLRQKVLKDGLIPAIGTAKPLGEITNDAVLKMVQQIKASGVQVRVQLIAAAQTRAGDQLKLDFRLR